MCKGTEALEQIAKFKEIKEFKEHMRQSHEQGDQFMEGNPPGLVIHYKQGLLKSSIFLNWISFILNTFIMLN